MSCLVLRYSEYIYVIEREVDPCDHVALAAAQLVHLGDEAAELARVASLHSMAREHDDEVGVVRADAHECTGPALDSELGEVLDLWPGFGGALHGVADREAVEQATGWVRGGTGDTCGDGNCESATSATLSGALAFRDLLCPHCGVALCS